MTVFLYCFREREEMLQHVRDGQRPAHDDLLLPRRRHLRMELPLGFFERVKKFLDTLSASVDEYENLLTQNPIWMERTKGVAQDHQRGRSCPGAQRAHGARQRPGLGPAPRHAVLAATRTSSSRFRWRKEGDVYARYLVRVQELRESNKIVKQALEGMPEGPIKADAPKVVLPDREKMKTQMEALIYHFKIVTEGFTRSRRARSIRRVESPRGEMGYLRRQRRHRQAVPRAHALAVVCQPADAARDVRGTADCRRCGRHRQHRHCSGGC